MSQSLPDAAAKVFDSAEQSIRLTRASISASFGKAMVLLENCTGKVVVTGMGKSGLAARKIAATLASTGCPAIFLNAADALHGDLGMVTGADVVVMLSNHAATDELVRMIPALRKLGAATVGIFGRDGTALARAVDVLLVVAVSSEGCPLDLAPMASTLASIAVGDAMAASLMARRGFTPEDFALRHPGGSLGRRLLMTARDVMHGRDRVAVLGPDSSLRDLVAALTRNALGAVCISRDGETLDGLVSDGDIRRAIMKEDPFAVHAADIMSVDPVTIGADLPLAEVLAVMEQPARRIYVVPVVDASHKILGLVRMHDIIA